VSNLLVPLQRLQRWVENFGSRHGATELTVDAGGLLGRAEDGSWFLARLPFDEEYGGPADVAAFGAAATPPESWGVLLVRKGGFAVARLAGDRLLESKVGQRHVQGRTKAGGQSQQRFARRRDNQARDAYRAAADHAVRVLGPVPIVVAGGDRPAVTEVLADPRLTSIRVTEPWLAVPDPRRAVLDQAIADAQAVRVAVENA